MLIRLVNVIGSPGSVVPIFLKQIEERRPVTVTHPGSDPVVYVVERSRPCDPGGGTAELEGRILVPELGAQTRITDLAAPLSVLPEVPIVFTGCRPGDKLTEELVSKTETIEGTIEGRLQLVRTCRLQPGDSKRSCNGSAIASRLTMFPDSFETPSAVPEYVPSGLLR